MINNHYSATLSDLDLEMAKHIPAGGNWKNIPESIPSKRLENIRESFKKGLGSRSTYYGRLKPDAPSYTINTYFNRPGNGCHLHYDYNGKQHRVISQREAARFQGFPDDFLFIGSKTAINKQIGNAVPTILAYQIARSLPFKKAQFVDLFSGAGGLSLGFVWSGWKPIVANDKEKYFLETYKKNIHHNVILGDIRNKKIRDKILSEVEAKRDPNLPLVVVGGPPCQGFSTAGKKRSMEDDRNQLFYEYKKILELLSPDAFVFENVTGLLNMEKGKVLEMIKSELEQTVSHVDVWKLAAERYGVPQRRTRIVLVGIKNPGLKANQPQPVTYWGDKTEQDNLPLVFTAEEVLSDLPALKSGQDGSTMEYVSPPQNIYQKLMRGDIKVSKYLESIQKKNRL